MTDTEIIRLLLVFILLVGVPLFFSYFCETK